LRPAKLTLGGIVVRDVCVWFVFGFSICQFN